jgi:hypothetical protein
VAIGITVALSLFCFGFILGKKPHWRLDFSLTEARDEGGNTYKNQQSGELDEKVSPVLRGMTTTKH